MSRSIDVWIEPAVVFRELFANRPYSFWLDAGPRRRATRSYMGAAAPGRASVVSFDAPARTLTLSDAEGRRIGESHESIWDFLRRERECSSPAPSGSAGPLGWVGWFGYELHGHLLGLPTHPSRHADAALIYCDRGLEFDHEAQRIVIRAGTGPDGREWLDVTAARLEALNSGSPGLMSGLRLPQDPPTAQWRHSDAAYLEMIEECQELISAGEAYQLCLTNELRIAQRIDPLATFLALRESSPSAHAGYVRFGDVHLVSSSPESFLEISPAGTVTTRPIKGTRSRGAEPEADRRARDDLVTSDKERAENVMIVDLMRNDLGRVSELGSIAVPRLCEVESYAQVHQLVSTVTGRRRSGLSAVDVIMSCFPAGSMTGAPKHRAVTHLSRLEGGPRGIYSGCFGRLGTDGSANLSMTIRTMVIDADGISIGSGGGITALSVPQEELAEVKLKARALAGIVGAAPFV